MLATPGLDVVIPIYKRADLTRECIESILANWAEIESRSPRLVLVNDSPADAATVALLEGYAGDARIVRIDNPRNLGFVKSVNRGLAGAIRERRDVLLVNSDTKTFPGTMAALAKVAEADPQIGFACPRSNNASLCTLPHAPNIHGGEVATPVQAYERWKVLAHSMPEYSWAPTGVGFYLYIKSVVLRTVGLLSEAFGTGYEEENDFIMRAGKVGFRVVLANKAFAYHVGSASFRELGIDLDSQRTQNLQKIDALHPEFLPMVRRYEGSPRFRAEHLLGGLLRTREGKLRIVVDLQEMGTHFNGTNELAIGVLRVICKEWAERIDLSVVCPRNVFEFHRLGQLGKITRVDLATSGPFAIAIRLGQPFDLHHVNSLESLGAINVFGMLDTIAADCGALSLLHRLDDLWGHAAAHANGLFFISKFGEAGFLERFPRARGLPRYAELLPTKLSDYPKSQLAPGAEAHHILVMGNHFPHKASLATARALAAAFPANQIVALGAETFARRNLKMYRSGSLDDDELASLYLRAGVVVLPSFAEGFGFGLVHALASRRPIVCRDIPATREILATYRSVEGVRLFSDDRELVEAVGASMGVAQSAVDDAASPTWSAWVGGLMRFCEALAVREDVYPRLVDRVTAGDQLRRAVAFELAATQPVMALPQPVPVQPAIEPVESREALMALDAEAFVVAAYHTVLQRHPDATGLAAYVAALDSDMTKDQVVDALLESEEFQNRVIELPEGFESAGVPASLSELLGLDGEAFVVSAYRVVLCRKPDAAGLVHYVEALGRGESKAAIVRAMLESDEGRARAIPFPDLHVLETNPRQVA